MRPLGAFRLYQNLGVNMKRVSKYNLVLFDRLERVKQKETGSEYKGERGSYWIEKTGIFEPKKPTARVMLNRTFLTGLFSTNKRNVYTGDILQVEGKRKVVVKIIEEGKIEVFEKVPKEFRKAG
jgi:hypothetical protein